MALKFHLCQPKDLHVLVAVSRTAFIQAFEKANNPEDFAAYVQEAFSLETMAQQLYNKDTLFYLAYKGEELIGYFKTNEYGAQTEIKAEDGLELERIYVLQDFLGKGYGKEMLDRVFVIAQRKKKGYVWLGVWEHNQKAIGFYEKYGFVKFGTHPYYIGTDKQTDWMLKKKLV